MTNLETIDLHEFYKEYVPSAYRAPADPAGTGSTLQHQVGDSIYTIALAADGSISTAPGPAEAPLVAVQMTEPNWREVIAGKIDAGPLADPSQLTPERLTRLRELRGALSLELGRPDADPWRLSAVFNGAEAPAVTLMMAAEDYAAMTRGDLNSQMAFVTGKLKFQGDLGLLMKLGSLLG